MRWPLQPLQPFQQTQLQPPFGQSVDSLCHPWFTTINLSYRFPIFETSATALCGTTGIQIQWLQCFTKTKFIAFSFWVVFARDCIEWLKVCQSKFFRKSFYETILTLSHILPCVIFCVWKPCFFRCVFPIPTRLPTSGDRASAVGFATSRVSRQKVHHGFPQLEANNGWNLMDFLYLFMDLWERFNQQTGDLYVI